MNTDKNTGFPLQKNLIKDYMNENFVSSKLRLTVIRHMQNPASAVRLYPAACPG